MYIPWRRSILQTEILVIIKYIFIHIWFLVCCVALVLLHFVIIYFDAGIKTSFHRLWSSSSFSASGFLLLHNNSVPNRTLKQKFRYIEMHTRRIAQLLYRWQFRSMVRSMMGLCFSNLECWVNMVPKPNSLLSISF